MSFLSYFIPQVIAQSSSSYNKKIEVREINGRNILLVNGIQQTGGYTKKLWNIGLHKINNIHPKQILMFGVGGGGLFHYLHRIFPDAYVTGVDIDEEIINIGKQYFELDTIDNVKFIEQDARKYATNKNYDLIIVDLYIGNHVPAFVKQKPFLSTLERMLSPGGRIVMNYFDDKNQVDKAQTLFDTIARIFPHVERRSILRNIFFYVLK